MDTLDKLPLTGLRLAAFLTDSLLQKLPNPPAYAVIQEAVYSTVDSIAALQIPGDWLETPNGTTYTLTFKPEKGEPS